MTVCNGTLMPGDLCVIAGVVRKDPHPSAARCVGRTVVLLSWYALACHPELIPGIYWRVSGLPINVIGIHECLLRKIPGAPIDEVMEMEACA